MPDHLATTAAAAARRHHWYRETGPLNPQTIHLARVSLDGIVVHRRAATLQSVDDRAAGVSSWRVYLASGLLSDRFRVGAGPIHLCATLVSGRRIAGDVQVVERRDDAYGTTLILVVTSALQPVVAD